jgi:hypothetical protein
MHRSRKYDRQIREYYPGHLVDSLGRKVEGSTAKLSQNIAKICIVLFIT